MEFTYLREILDDLRTRFASKHVKSDFQLKQCLLLLGDFEKRLLKKKVLAFDYNIGALRVLKLLQEVNIVGFTDYLQAMSNESEIQGVITDVIDSKEMQDLLVDVVENSKSVDLVNLHFQECIKQYSIDLIERPELIQYEFVSGLDHRNDLKVETFRENILFRLFDELLSHGLNKSTELTEVICKQHDWSQRFKDDSFKVLSKLISNVLVKHSDALVKRLIWRLQTDLDLNWFMFLFVVNLIGQKSDVLKQLLKNLFAEYHETDNVARFHMMIALARQLYHFSPDPGTSYKKWVKETIGEMHGQLKSADKFKNTIESLQQLIFFESDVEVLEVHQQTAISAPRGMNTLVLEYKQMLRTRIASFAEPETFMDLT